jgi:type VI secretion system ImpM family protein
MTAVGMFGKVPSFGDFVSMGSGSPLHRGFERWLEDSNDVLATRRQELSKNPLGLMIRGEDSADLLVGILVGSCDSVGRTFPLGMFHEVRTSKASLAGLPLAMAPDLGRLAGVARKARVRGHHEIQGLLRDAQRPNDDEIAIRSRSSACSARPRVPTMASTSSSGRAAWPRSAAASYRWRCRAAPIPTSSSCSRSRPSTR